MLNLNPETMTNNELKLLVASLSVAQAKTDAQMAKTDAQMARTEAQMAKTFAQMAKNDEQRAKNDEQMAKNDAKFDKLSERYGGISDNLGSVAEEFFFNTLKANPVIGDIHFDRVTPNLIVGQPATQAEFDLVLVNGHSVAMLEVKHKAHLSALDQLEKQMRRYRLAFPEHAGYKLYGGVAGLSVPEATVHEAHKRGMFVLKQKGDAFAVDTQAMRAF